MCFIKGEGQEYLNIASLHLHQPSPWGGGRLEKQRGGGVHKVKYVIQEDGELNILFQVFIVLTERLDVTLLLIYNMHGASSIISIIIISNKPLKSDGRTIE